MALEAMVVALAVRVSRDRKGIAVKVENAAKVFADRKLQVGFFSTARYDDDKGTNKPVAGVAAVHELGSTKRNIPARSFMRTTAEENQKEWAGIFADAMTAVIEGQISADDALNQIGSYVVGQVQGKIEEIQEPKLKDATVERKGFAKPLIQSGLMKDSLTHKVSQKE